MLSQIEQLLHRSNLLCAAVQANAIGNYQEASRQLEALRVVVPPQSPLKIFTEII